MDVSAIGPCRRVRAALAGLMLCTAMTTAVSAADLSRGQLRIGVLNDLTGPYKDLGGIGSVIAAGMAVDDAHSGLAVEIVSADHHNDPSWAVDQIHRWQAEPGGLDVVVDVPNSAVALAVQQVAHETGLVHINISAAAPDLTGRSCTETGVHWVFDTYALASSVGRALVDDGGTSWYFLTADYIFGHRLEADASAAVFMAGGDVLGGQRHPFGSDDFTAYLRKAMDSGAAVLGLADAGTDMVKAVQQASALGVQKKGMRIAALLTFISEVHALGLKTAQGLVLTTGWYWDLNDRTRAFARRFQARAEGVMPTMTHAGTYSAVSHYLAAVLAAGTDSGPAVVAAMRASPVNDIFTTNGVLRPDGRMVHDMYLVKVKSPEDSQRPWDYYQVLQTIPGDVAFRAASASGCVPGN